MKKFILTSMLTCIFSINSFALSEGKVTPAAENTDNVKVTILGSSDLHGRFVPWEYASDKENMTGSLTQISSLISEVRKENPNTILIDAGDAIQDNMVETFNKGPVQPMVLGMNYLNYDAWIMGNHEFNFGLDVLKNVTSQFNGAVLGGNIYNTDGSRFMDATTIIEKNGVKIGLIGITTPMIAQFENPDHIKGIEFRDTVKETKKAIADLTGKVDAIIGVMHMGLENENNIPNTGISDIAKECPELTAIIGGHMHALVKETTINGVLITEPGKYGQALSKIDLNFTKKDGKYQLDSKKTDAININNLPSDTNLEKLLEPYHTNLRENVNSPIGELKGINMVDENEIAGTPTIHIEDTPLVDFFHEVSLYYSNADVIGLGIDNDAPKLDIGPIKKKDIAFNYRYTSGEITVYEVKGSDLKKYMEWSAGYYNTLNPGDITVSFNPKRRASKYSTNDMFGGINYKIDLTQKEGNRIKDVKFKDGREIKDTDVIKLGMNSYRMEQLLAKGGIFEGLSFNKLWDSKVAIGEEAGTIRNMSIDYIMNVKKGLIESKKENNWTILGIDRTSKEYKKVVELVNNGTIKVPSTEDGKYTNIASINIKDLPKDSLIDNTDTINPNIPSTPVTPTPPGDTDIIHITGTTDTTITTSTNESSTTLKSDINKATALPKTGRILGATAVITLSLISLALGAFLLRKKHKSN
ncbi:bifunctional metallophosphatase/5'-nucleotidase [Clostridium gasigenes]|uniref:bifunctional metallophosphatase/5'-nucleotidase n=1 Tax=Clostridium gasigenes TaxID=94869 RepID=UPI001C0B44E6|nr:5'-nucleotidase C-terminal domain-containing protein [Clostridium gasigenes]MBU3108465.1 5'-nucleotidase C-terminal domain-containing protein [Clostridium gasigenes]